MDTETDITHLAAGLDAILRPRSVAVVGASRREGSLGHGVVQNLLGFGFQGPVYPVHQKADHVASIRAYPTVDAIPDPVDLAVVVVPRTEVVSVVEACAKKGVRGLVVITAGFREVGLEGATEEARLQEIVRRHGMRMIGPNCMGILNTDPKYRLNASFSATRPRHGNAGFASQSGALGEVVLATACAVGLGVSQFVSLGNKADVSGNDLLAYWANDPQTEVILLYLESFGNPRRFATLARHITRVRGKPILVVKSGRTAQGAAAASSHTGSLAGSDQAASAMLSSCGVIRCDTVMQLFDFALGFCNQPPPGGSRVAVLTNAGGPGIMATDASIQAGLTLADLASATEQALGAALPPEASVRNPVDMIASAGAEQYRRCAATLLADDAVDALLVIFVSPVVMDPPAVARGIVAGVTEGLLRAGRPKTVLACFMGRDLDDRGIAILSEAKIPNYPFPEAAVRTLEAMTRFQSWRAQAPGREVRFAVDAQAARRLVDKVQADGRTWLSGIEAMELLQAYGIPTAPSQRVSGPDEAIAFADEVGYPVVLKLDAASVLHKSDVGGVKIDLRSPGEIKGAFWDMQASVQKGAVADARYLVQKMVTDGTETIIGAAQDAHVGHLLMFGLGGIYVELMRDVAFRIHPITDADAERMTREIKGAPLLDGHRGAEPVDRQRLTEVLLRVNQLIADFPMIAEMDLNPFMAQPRGRGGVVVDARVRLEPEELEPPIASLRGLPSRRGLSSRPGE
ncbi:MAG: acetate--CoA ligase family protein [Myxococcales bacterium]|nr:acetate--CoA ligase family protein [Myxococcales bacterium]